MNQDMPWIEEELTAHSQWVRRLARSLVHDETAADDLVQDTWVAALSRPPSDRQALRGWLGRVVRTLAWKRQRRASTGSLAGDEGEIPEGTPGSELIERLELHRILAEELRAMKEPLRTTLLQRYFEGRSAAEIAQLSGAPAPTVRWRLQQGLEELRTRLDARFGGKRETWMSALAFALPSKGTVLGGSGVAIGGGLIMTALKVSVGAAALVVTLILTLQFLARDEAPAQSGVAQAEIAARSAPAREPQVDISSPTETQDGSHSARAAVDQSSAAVGRQAGPRVVAHIIDENQRPIANAWLRRGGPEAEIVQVDPGDEARTGTDGLVVLLWKGELPRYAARFVLGGDGFATVRREGTMQIEGILDLGDVILRPGGCVRGRVVDGEQNPLPGADVVISPGNFPGRERDLELMRNCGPWRSADRLASKCALDGSFLIEGVPTGTTRAWAHFGNLRWAVTAPIEVAPGGVLNDVLLVVDSASSSDPELAHIEGLVLGADGKPLARPQLEASSKNRAGSWSYRVIGGEDGHFRVQPQTRVSTLKLEAWDAGNRYSHTVLADVKPGTTGLEIRLAEMKSLVIVATDEHGPVERFRVRGAGEEKWSLGQFLDKDEIHVDGRASVPVTGDSCWYSVSAAGHRTEKIGPIDGRSPPASLAILLTSVHGVRGRVVSGDIPIAGAQLRLCEQPEAYSGLSEGFTALVKSSSIAQTTSGADGTFSLDLQRDGRFSILADAAGYARSQFGPVEVRAEEGLDEVLIRLDAGGTLEGRVLMPAGQSSGSVVVGISRGDANPYGQTVGPDGAFRFEHLTPGPWELRRMQPAGVSSSSTWSTGGPDRPVLRNDFTITAGQTTHKDLDLRDDLPCVIEIDLQNNSGPSRAWTIRATPVGNYTHWGGTLSATTDANGHARLELAFTTKCQLTATPPAESASDFMYGAELTLQRGANSWTQDIKTGRIEGTIANWTPDSGIVWHIEGEAQLSSHELRPDASGHFVLPLVSAGKVTVVRWKTVDGRLTNETLQTFQLAAKETKVLQLP